MHTETRYYYVGVTTGTEINTDAQNRQVYIEQKYAPGTVTMGAQMNMVTIRINAVA